jgi:hypothetical protein
MAGAWGSEVDLGAHTPADITSQRSIITMRNGKTLMVALLAVFAFSAVAASAASAALPEWAGAAKENKSFTSKSGITKLKVKNGITVTCKKSTNKGNIVPGSNKKEGTVVVTFQECFAAGVDSCKSATGAAGEIITNPLTMELGYIVKATEVGVSLVPSAGKKEPLATFECAIGTGESVVVTGSVIGKITPLNKAGTTKFELTLAENAKEEQVPTKFETGAEDTLKASVGGATATAATETTEKPDEIEFGSPGEEILA